jgi:hypothetical protein
MQTAGRIPRSAAVAERLGELGQIVDLGLTASTRDGFQKFLTVSQPRFSDRTALQTIERGDAQRVTAALAADHDEAGASGMIDTPLHALEKHRVSPHTSSGYAPSRTVCRQSMELGW